jgi:tetratricopeptide (TPR) repeat protein
VNGYRERHLALHKDPRMPFAIACPACQTSLRVAADPRGKQCVCPKCGQLFLVGGAPVPQRAEVRPAAPPVPAPPPAAAPPPTAPRRRWLVPEGLVGVALLGLAAGLSWPFLSPAPRQGEPVAAVTGERTEPTELRDQRRPDGPGPATEPRPSPTTNTPPAAKPEPRADEAQDPYKLGVQAADCLNKGQSGEALKLAEQAIRLDPKAPWYHGLAGAAHWQLKQYPAGLKECESAIRLAAGKDDAWYYRVAGDNAYGTQDIPLARKYYQQAVAAGDATAKDRVAEQDADKLGAQANDCLNKGQPGEALKLAEQAIHLQPQNAWYHGLAGAAHWGLKEYPAGLKECESAIRLAAGKDDAWYLFVAGENALETRDYLLARKYYEQAVARGEKQLGGNFRAAQARLLSLPSKIELNKALKFNPFEGARREEVPEICQRAIETYFLAEAQYRAGDFQAARATLDSLWKQYPVGGQVWMDTLGASEVMARHANVYFGYPAAYYSLRMLDDCVRFRLQPRKQAVQPQTVVLTMLLLGHSRGIQPQNEEELRKGLGKMVTHTLDPRISADNYRILHDEVWLLGEYLQAMTDGRLVLKTRIHPMPDFTATMRAYAAEASGGWVAAGRHMEGYADGEWWRVFGAVPLRVQLETDWWVVMHPLLMNDVPAFGGDKAFCPGGMGAGPDRSPAFITDDLSQIRRWPDYYCSGPFNDYERRLVLQQWYQHEFFHHLYREYPGLRLEINGHDWFDRKFWPADFRGAQEADYYHESLYKRLQPLGEPPLHVRLKYSQLAPPDVLAKLTPEMVVGKYVQSPKVEDPWGEGAITLAKEKGKAKLLWTNKANASWSLDPDFASGILISGQDCPYVKDPRGQYTVLLLKHEGGTPRVTGFRFMGNTYLRRD